MIESTACIQNDQGIHCRPTALIVKYCSKAVPKIKLVVDEEAIDSASFLAVMSLGLMKGDEVAFCVDGENEEQIAKEFKELLETEFDFPQN